MDGRFQGRSIHTYVLDPSRTGFLLEDIWPSLFYGSERIPEIRRKIEELIWARRMYSQMIEESKKVIESPPFLPRGRPGWRHDFYSPTTGQHLPFTSQEDSRFGDPSDGSVLGEGRFKAAWILLQHERTFRLVRSIGVLYQLTRREIYSDWVAQGMSWAVDFFKHADRSKDRYSALYFQPLYDSQIVLLLANCYDLTRGSPSYQAYDTEAILRNIFGEGSRSLLDHHRDSQPHNITAYVTAAIGAIGTMLDREELVELAMSDDPRGLQGLLAHGLRRNSKGVADGFWFEGTTFYHFYAMFPLFYLYELAKVTGIDHRALSRVRRDLISMARMPTLLVDEHLRLPWFGDLGSPEFPGLSGFSHLYEYAAGMLDSSFAGTLCACLRRGDRAGLAALAFGPDSLPKIWIIETPAIFPVSGITTLRARDEEGSYYVAFRSGRHGAGHDHFDKLGVVIHALGEVIAPDIGTSGYSLRAFKTYCMSTLAHNTLMVNEQNQRRVDDAVLRRNGSNGVIGVLRDAYKGVVVRRRVTLKPPRILLEDAFSSTENHRYAWIFHARGKLKVRTEDVEGEKLPPLPKKGPFEFLTDRVTRGPTRMLEAQWQVNDDIVMTCRSEWDHSFEPVSGTTPSNPMTSQLGALIMRSEGRIRRIRTTLEIRRT